MIRLFSFFGNYCAQHYLDPTQYRITITPLTLDAEARLKGRWSSEMGALCATGKESAEGCYAGRVFGVPFKIDEALK